jgi:hypothetical protein
MQFTGNLARLQRLALGPQSVLLDLEKRQATFDSR